MSLIGRITRLFRSDMNALLDCIEEPQTLMRQAIREMDEALTADQQQLRVIEGEYNILSERVTQLNERVDQSREELDVCFESDVKALAKTLIKRQLEIKSVREDCVQRQQALQQSASTLTARITENSDRLALMRGKAAALFDDSSAPKSSDVLSTTTNITDDAVFLVGDAPAHPQQAPYDPFAPILAQAATKDIVVNAIRMW